LSRMGRVTAVRSSLRSWRTSPVQGGRRYGHLAP